MKVLARVACLAPGEPIPYHLLKLTLNLPEQDFNAAIESEDGIRRLAELGLVRSEKGDAIQLHRLVVAFVRDVLADQIGKAQEIVETAVIQEAAHINEGGDPRPLLAWQLHLRTVTQAALHRKDLIAAKLCNELGGHLWLSGDYPDSQFYYELALDIRRSYLGEYHPDTAHSHDRLGFVLRTMGKFDEALACYQQALNIREAVLGEEHSDTAITLNELGRWYEERGDVIESKSYYERALAVGWKALGEEHPLTAEYLNNVGMSLIRLGKLDDALDHFRRALTINEQAFGLI